MKRNLSSSTSLENRAKRGDEPTSGAKSNVIPPPGVGAVGPTEEHVRKSEDFLRCPVKISSRGRQFPVSSGLKFDGTVDVSGGGASV